MKKKFNCFLRVKEIVDFNKSEHSADKALREYGVLKPLSWSTLYLTLEARDAAALVFANFVDAGSVVLTAVILTIVHVLLTPHTFEPGRTLAPETKYFQKYFETISWRWFIKFSKVLEVA